jgi:hypothetical protein
VKLPQRIPRQDTSSLPEPVAVNKLVEP